MCMSVCECVSVSERECVNMCVTACVNVHVFEGVEVREQLCGVISLFPPLYAFQESKRGHQVCTVSALPAKSSCCLEVF